MEGSNNNNNNNNSPYEPGPNILKEFTIKLARYISRSLRRKS